MWGRLMSIPAIAQAGPLVASVGAVAAFTGILIWLDTWPQAEHLVFIYLLPTTFIAVRYGSMLALFATVLSVLAAAYFFYSPTFSFYVSSWLNMIELVSFVLLALLATQVVAGFARDRSIKRRRPGPRR